MSQTHTLIVDDQSPAIQYLCPTVNQQVIGTYYNSTWSTVESDDCKNGWFQYEFNGTAIHIAASVHAGEAYSVKLDNGEFVTQSGDGSFTSSQLSDGKHIVTYAVAKGPRFSAPTFDYLAVTTGVSTSMKGQTVAVDDNNPAITYGGNWKTSPPVDIPDGSLSLHQGTTHWTSSVGDTLAFQFSGTSISVLGILANLTQPGNLTVAYTLDGNTSTEAIDKDTFQLLPMVELFRLDVVPGEHTLLVNITNIASSQALGIDLITYNTTSAYSGAPANAALPGATSAASSNLGSKVGAVIGSVAAVLLLLGAFFIWRHRRQKVDKLHKKLAN